jgi:predicted TPR repeat methyltransferase
MLNIAKQKNVYQSLDLVDLTKKLDYEDNLFDAVICAGTLPVAMWVQRHLGRWLELQSRGGIYVLRSENRNGRLLLICKLSMI